jgi:uncharacterized protein YkwD
MASACQREGTRDEQPAANTQVAAVCPTPPLEQLELELDLVGQVNELRARGGACEDLRGHVSPIAPAQRMAQSAALDCAARQNSQDMAQTGHFAHRNLEQQGPRERSRRAGYTGTAVLENLAWGQRTTDAVISAWLGSRDHCRALFAPGSNEVGVGVAVGPGSKPFWTLLLGTR